MIEEIINNFKKFLHETGILQTTAAKDLNISKSHLSKILNRHDNPSTTLLIRMEEYMYDNQRRPVS